MKIFATVAVIAELFAVQAEAAPRVVSMDIYSNGTKVLFEVDAAPDMSFQIPAAFNIDSIKPVMAEGD